jgi:hypothetical protein
MAVRDKRINYATYSCHDGATQENRESSEELSASDYRFLSHDAAA